MRLPPIGLCSQQGDNSCNVQNSGNGSEKEGDCRGDESEDVDEDEVSDVDADSDDRLQDDDLSPADCIADYNCGDECQKEDDVHTEFRPSQTNVHSNGYDQRSSSPRGNEVPSPLAARDRRRLQKKKSKQRALERAKAALKAERMAAMTWKPRRCVPVTPVVGMWLNARLKCEQLAN